MAAIMAVTPLCLSSDSQLLLTCLERSIKLVAGLVWIHHGSQSREAKVGIPLYFLGGEIRATVYL